jgi:hypothetical protein
MQRLSLYLFSAQFFLFNTIFSQNLIQDDMNLVPQKNFDFYSSTYTSTDFFNDWDKNRSTHAWKNTYNEINYRGPQIFRPESIELRPGSNDNNGLIIHFDIFNGSTVYCVKTNQVYH